MIRFFRKIRESLLTRGKLGSYSVYAIGEIILVVIGILIALQINNWNEANKTRNKELIYLENIKQDLNLNITSLEEFMKARESTVQSVDVLLEYYKSAEELDLNVYNMETINVLVWYPFIQHANTFHELMNSGNFAIISNKTLKNELQDMQTSYGKIAFIENEMQQDYERYLYEYYFEIIDLETSFKNMEAQLVGDDISMEMELDISQVESLMKIQKYKNGLMLASYNSALLLEEYSNMKDRTNQLISLIDDVSGNQ